MKTQKEIEEKLTPEIIKKMCELAEGYEFERDEDGYHGIINVSDDFYLLENIIRDMADLPLLIHRAVEGWNNKFANNKLMIHMTYNMIHFFSMTKPKHVTEFMFKNYQPSTLTACECALLDCLIEVLK
jgi:hypothetical protein